MNNQREEDEATPMRTTTPSDPSGESPPTTSPAPIRDDNEAPEPALGLRVVAMTTGTAIPTTAASADPPTSNDNDEDEAVLDTPATPDDDEDNAPSNLPEETEQPEIAFMVPRSVRPTPGEPTATMQREAEADETESAAAAMATGLVPMGFNASSGMDIDVDELAESMAFQHGEDSTNLLLSSPPPVPPPTSAPVNQQSTQSAPPAMAIAGATTAAAATAIAFSASEPPIHAPEQPRDPFSSPPKASKKGHSHDASTPLTEPNSSILMMDSNHVHGNETASSDSYENNLDKHVEEDLDDDEDGFSPNARSSFFMENTVPGAVSGWTRGILKIHKIITKLLQCISGVAVRYPRITLILLSGLSLGMLAAGLFTNFEIEADNHDLWPPAESKSIEQSNWVYEDSRFNYNPVTMEIILHQKGQNVLGLDGPTRVFEIFDLFTSEQGYKEGCAFAERYGHLYWVGQCRTTSVADFWMERGNLFRALARTDEEAIRYMSEPTYKIAPDDVTETYPEGLPVETNKIFGNAVRDESSGLLTHADSYRIEFAIPWSNVTLDFEEVALENMLRLRDSYNADPSNPWVIEVRSFSSYSNEFLRAILADLWLIPVAAFIVSAFTVLCAFGKCHRVQSRGLLGVGAVLTIVASLMTTFGILFIIGIPFTTQTMMVPFLMFGIGLDDAFIIYGSYNRKDPNKDIPSRIRSTFQDVGISIFLTSLTSMLAFVLGSFSTIPAVKWLCLYAFPAVGIDFFYQITFFVALIALDERRIQQNRMDYCTCITVRSKDVDPTEYPSNSDSDEKENQSGEDDEDDVEADLAMAAAMEENGGDCAPAGTTSTAARATTTPPHVADRIMGWWANQLLKPAVQKISMVAFVALAGVSIFFATKLDQEFDFTDLVPADSYVKDYYTSLDDYTESSGMFTQAFFRYIDHSDPEIQQQMIVYIDELVATNDLAQPMFFWLWDFQKYSQQQYNDPNSTFPIKPFNRQVNQFLREDLYHDLYNEHIGFSSRGEVVDSRCNLDILVDAKDSKAAVDMLANLRQVSGSQPVNQGTDDWSFFTYSNEYHLYEFYREVVEELVFTSFMGLLSVNVIALFFIPHWTAVLFIFPFISLLYTNMLGFLYLAGVQINAISYITLVMSIGLMIDYIMHILMRYYDSKGTREERVRETMSSMGASIFLGAASTFLGILALALSTSEILQNIFVAVVGLISFGILNGLIFLPVTLSLVGPQ